MKSVSFSCIYFFVFDKVPMILLKRVCMEGFSVLFCFLVFVF